MDREIDKLVELLSIVYEENLDCQLAEGMMEKLDWSKMTEISGVFENLYHYFHDEDIRLKDNDYAKMQDGELFKLIAHLKSENFEHANRVSFLCET